MLVITAHLFILTILLFVLYYKQDINIGGFVMEKVVLNVEGMSCAHCTAAVKTAVEILDGIQKVKVDLQAKTATVEYDPSQVTLELIYAAIEDQGFDVTK